MLEQWKPCTYQIFCAYCKKGVTEGQSHTRCPRCDGALDIRYDMDSVMEDKPFLYPLKSVEAVVSLQEGNTPLYKIESMREAYGVSNLFLKNEGANPTGVFKDRGSFMEVSKAKEMGAELLVVASSGNMAASCSAYAAKAGIPIFVFVPEKVPFGKLAQIVSYGARVLKIRGTYGDCVKLVHTLAPKLNMHILGDYLFRREGQKGLAYELVGDLGRAPDVVIVPTGAGTHIAGLWRGFQEYYQLGLIEKLPRMVAVQPKGAGVIVESFEKKEKVYKEWHKTLTVCSAVDVEDPNDGVLALAALYESKGTAVGLSDESALEAQYALASKEGVFIEPSSALSLAALKPLKESGFFQKEDTVVCIATGNGLKDAMTPLSYLPKVLTFEPGDEKGMNKVLKVLIQQ